MARAGSRITSRIGSLARGARGDRGARAARGAHAARGALGGLGGLGGLSGFGGFGALGAVLAAAAVIAAGGCEPRPAPIASCLDDLRGEYAAGASRWMILDQRATLEAYPLFDDVTALAAAPANTGLELGPRVLELSRGEPGEPLAAGELRGFVRRRYMSGVQVCVAKVPVRVTACAHGALELVLHDPAPPLSWAPCTWPRLESSRFERWVRR